MRSEWHRVTPSGSKRSLLLQLHNVAEQTFWRAALDAERKQVVFGMSTRAAEFTKMEEDQRQSSVI